MASTTNLCISPLSKLYGFFFSFFNFLLENLIGRIPADNAQIGAELDPDDRGEPDGLLGRGVGPILLPLQFGHLYVSSGTGDADTDYSLSR